MLFAIIISILPLTVKTPYPAFLITDVITAALFIADYILRLITADLKLNKGASSFVLYPFTPFAVIDLISILPFLSVISGGFRLLRLFRVFRFFRLFRALRVFKALRYSKSMEILIIVLNRSKDALLAVYSLVIGHILITALIIFNAEGNLFISFFEAVYWSTVSLTTIGYGDISPVTVPGRAITILSSIVGIAVFALPTGIITAGYMDVLNSRKNEGE